MDSYLLTSYLQYSGDGSTVAQKMHGLFSPQIAGNLCNFGCGVRSYDIVLTSVTSHESVRCHSQTTTLHTVIVVKISTLIVYWV